MYLLDTNVVSELRKARSGRADPAVAAWAERVPAGFMYLSVISVHELDYGIALARRKDAAKAQALHRWLHGSVLTAFAGRLLPVDVDVALTASEFMVPDPTPFRDALIGATAVAHELTVVTRNTRDYERMGVPLVDPWQ